MSFLKTFLTLVVLAGAVATAGAAAYVEDWDQESDDIYGWNFEDIDGGASYSALDWEATVDGVSGVLRIIGGGAQGGIIEDIIFADSTSSAGNVVVDNTDLTGAMTVVFDFYASEVPVSLDLYFEDNSGVQWVMGIALPSTGWNYNYSQMLSYSVDWSRLDGGTESSATFLSSLQIVDEVGIVIGFTGSGTEIYGLDNFAIVPEPETWLMLGIALLSLGYTFRKRLSESIVAIRIRS